MLCVVLPLQPVMAANMDTVGRFEMAKELSKHKVFTCVHKHYSVEQVRARRVMFVCCSVQCTCVVWWCNTWCCLVATLCTVGCVRCRERGCAPQRGRVHRQWAWRL